MERTNYQEAGTYDYNAWWENTDCGALLQYINCNVLPQYTSCNALPQYACFMEPLKYNDISVHREHKDLLFRILMRDKKNLLSVYNALNRTNYEHADELEIMTLEDAVYMS
ncbi:MAG: hypothetical protein NC086_09325 [Alistipes sp.]|nr:hypothetical protein [Alistipes sp.]